MTMDLFDLVRVNLSSSKTAVEYCTGTKSISLTYQELGKLSEKITAVFEIIGVRGEVVGIGMEDSIYAIPVILSCLKSSAAFHSLNAGGVSYLSNILISVGIRLLVIHQQNVKKFSQLLESLGSAVMHEMSFGKETVLFLELSKIPVKKYRENLAYCITTSGTTAEPKVVCVPHSCIVSNTRSLLKIFNLCNDVVFLFSPFTFDPSIIDIFLSLMSESCLLMVPKQLKLSRRYMENLIFQKRKITYMQTTPSFFMGFKNIKDFLLGDDSTLKILALGGESFPPVLSWKSEKNKTKIFNLYGITELSCWASCYEVTGHNDKFANDVNIGPPLENTELFVKNHRKEQITDGEGELIVSGKDGRFCYLLSDGKLQPQLAHHTGDWVKISGGEIKFLHRMDEQLKRNGQRINLLQIKKVIREYPSVSHAEVFMERCLIFAAVVVDQTCMAVTGRRTIEQALRKLTQDKLPSHSRPDHIISMVTLPVTNHGKFDKHGIIRNIETQKEIFNETEELSVKKVKKTVREIWNNSLSTPCYLPVQENSSFTSLGGDSLMALRFLSTVESKMNLTCPELLDIIVSETYSAVESYIIGKLRQLTGGCNGKTDFVGIEDHSTSASEPNMKSRRENSETLLHYCISRCGRIVDTLSHGTSPGVPPFVPLMFSSVTSSGTYLHESWKYNTGKCVDSSPLIAKFRDRSIVFIGSHSHKVAALDTNLGKALWEITLGDRVESSAAISVCGNYLTVGCYDSYVYVILVATGNIWWKYKTGSTVKCSPLVDTKLNSMVYVGSHDSFLHAVNINERKLVFKLHLQGGSVFSSPCLASGADVLYCCTLAGNIAAVHPVHGTLLWIKSVSKPIFSSPAASDTHVYVGDVGGSMHCFSATGQKEWSFQCAGPIFSSPCLYTEKTSTNVVTGNEQDRLVFGCHDCHIYCLDIKGKLIWKVKVKSPVYSSPFVFCVANVLDRYAKNIAVLKMDSSENFSDNLHDTKFDGGSPIPSEKMTCSKCQETEKHGTTKMSNSENMCCVACTSGCIYVINMCSNRIVCEHRCPGEIFSSPVVHFPHVYVGCRDDFLYCFEIKR